VLHIGDELVDSSMWE